MFSCYVIYFYTIIYNQHGGSDNAYTDTENTNYHFDVNADCLEEALDRYYGGFRLLVSIYFSNFLFTTCFELRNGS